MRFSQQGFLSVVIFILIAVLIVAFLIAIVLLPKKDTGGVQLAPTSHIQTSGQAAQSGTPQIKTTDMAPKVATAQKTAILVQHSDSSFEKFLIASTSVDAFTSALPKGDKVVSITPLK